MEKVSFHENWRFCKGAGTALDSLSGKKNDLTPVTLPHDAMILNKRQKDLPYGNCVGYFLMKRCIIRRSSTLRKQTASIWNSKVCI